MPKGEKMTTSNIQPQNKSQKTIYKNTKNVISGLVFVVCLGFGILMFGFLLTGCATQSSSTNYYYSPSWTRGGSVIFLLGNQLDSAYYENVSTMTAAGSGVSTVFDATGATPYSMTCSPTGEYVAYLNNLNSGLFSKIVIRNIATGAHSGLDKVELSFSPGVVSCDWSNTGTKLVYCTTREVRTVNLDGTGDSLVTAEADLEFVAWKYGGRIAFVHATAEGQALSLIYPDGSGRLNLPVAASVAKPQISATNTNEVYGIASGSYCLVNVAAATPATAEIYANFKGELPRLSPAADKVVYSKTGESSGIYILDLATSAETTVK